METHLERVQLNVTELSSLEAHAASVNRVSLHTSLRTGTLIKRNDVEYARLEPLAREEIPSHRHEVEEIGRELFEYQLAIRDQLDAIAREDSLAAHLIHERRTDSIFDTLIHRTRGTARDLEQLAARHDRNADLGSLIAVLAALALSGWLLWKSSRARHASDLRRTEERMLHESAHRLRALVENASDTIVVVDEHGVVRNMAGSVESLLGEEWESLRGAAVDTLVHPDDRPLLVSFLANTALEPGKGRSAELRMASGKHAWRHIEVLARNLLDVDHIRGIVLTIRDISARKELENQLRHRAFHDALTQLPNRALFQDRVEHALATDGRSDQLTAVLFADLDDFKDVNDTLGRAGGDELLAQVARRITASLRPADTAARLGGDEFGILLEAIGGSGEALAIADRILRSFDEPFIVQGKPLQVRASVGIAISAQAVTAVEALLRNADLAMYAAKRKGKARYEMFDEELEQVVLGSGDPGANGHGANVGRIGWVLRGAEEREEMLSMLARPETIETVFQPIVDIRTGHAAGYEALSRFHAARNRPPDAWFEVAHRCGLGARLEAVALRLALRRAEQVPAGAYVSVNLSPSALVSEEVQAVLPEDLSDLVIEITENELVTEGNTMQSALAQLRVRGARLACDDAGAGYAGLRQLMRLRPEIIKLDRTLIDDVHADLAKRALVESMVRYARNIGASVCAEGIESLEDLAALADLDVTYGQGYALARPAPPWAPVSAEALAVCSTSLSAVIGHEELGRDRSDSGDHRLEQISRRLFESTRPGDLQEVMALVAAELRADEVVCQTLDSSCSWLQTVATYGWQAPGDTQSLADLPMTRHVIDTGEALQVLVSDPEADAAELDRMVANGVRSLLKIPITALGHTFGVLEAWSHKERPWTRTEIHRARVISYQLGAVLQALDGRNAARARAQTLPLFDRHGSQPPARDSIGAVPRR